MGYSYNSNCYDTINSANDAYFPSLVPTNTFSNNNTYTIVYEKISNSWRLTTYQTTPSPLNTRTVYSTQSAITPNYNSCSLIDSYNDGMSLGWHFGLILIVTMSIIFIKRVL